MYCDFCGGAGVRYRGNDPADCTHCGGTGYEPNNYFGSLDPDWCGHQKKHDPNWDEYWGVPSDE